MKEIITYANLISDPEFRNYVERRLASGADTKNYSFGTSIPKLYKYRALSKYAVDDIVNNWLTASNVSEFNDIFDGAIHYCGTPEECEMRAEQEWRELDDLSNKAGFPGILQHDEMVKLFADHNHSESRLKFRMASFVGTYVCSLSTKNDSTLMWSHYANSNTGICIEYDFRESNIVFPVAYSKEPIDIVDLIEEDSKAYGYPLDAAIQCAVLNKSSEWKYESEWRVVFVFPYGESKRRMSLKAPSKPVSIALGYHFLKPFFYFQTDEREAAKTNIENLKRLLKYAKENSVSMYVMVPSIGEYTLSRMGVDVDDLIKFMHYHFEGSSPENIRYYDTIHDHLMDVVEKHK